MDDSLTRPSDRHSVFLFTHRLTAGAYQITWFNIEDLVWSLVLICCTVISTRKVSNVPAGTVTCSRPVTFASPDVRKARPDCRFMALPSDRHSLPTCSGFLIPRRSLGRYFQMPS